MTAIEAIEELWGTFCPDCGPDDHDGVVAHVKHELERLQGELVDERSADQEIQGILRRYEVDIVRLQRENAVLRAEHDAYYEWRWGDYDRDRPLCRRILDDAHMAAARCWPER